MSEAAKGLLPHLSFTRIDKYLDCPEQYRLYYLEGLRPRVPSASLLFGQTIHQALAFYFGMKGDPVAYFQKAWEDIEKMPVKYNGRATWSGLGFTGQALLKKFIEEELPRLGKVEASEKAFELAISDLDVPFVGVIDLIAERDGRPTVIDFKTSASAYQDHDVALSDQLSAYRLAAPLVQDAAFCIFVKTKEPRIDWYLGKRSGSQLAEFLKKASYVAKEITARHFYKRPGSWCSWCDFLPVCLGDTKRADESLIRVS